MKYKAGEILVLGLLSPPSRGAWIEIGSKDRLISGFWVAPLAGGVD